MVPRAEPRRQPFAPAAQTAARLPGVTAQLGRAKDAAMPFEANSYASTTEDDESLSGQSKTCLAPRGPVAGTVNVVKTKVRQSVVI
jgi:hypothetical protein